MQLYQGKAGPRFSPVVDGQVALDAGGQVQEAHDGAADAGHEEDVGALVAVLHQDAGHELDAVHQGQLPQLGWQEGSLRRLQRLDLADVGQVDRLQLATNMTGACDGVLWMGWILTPSLSGCYLQMTHKSAKFETLKPFCFLFLHWHVKGSPSKCIELKIDVTGLENILFAGTSKHHSARKFYKLGQ